MALKFLMSTCRYCGAPAKGKHYRLLLFLTPFALIFYAIIIIAFFYVGMTNPEYDNATGRIAVFISILVFLAPGLLLLFLLKRSRGVCDSCMQRSGSVVMRPIIAPQPVMAPAKPMSEKERPRLDRSELNAVEELLNSNPSAKEIIERNSARLSPLTMPLAQKVVQATTLEWANNIEEAAKLYEELGLRAEAARVRSKNSINMSASIKGLERIG